MDEALIKSEREEECWWIAEFLRIKAMAGKRARNATRGRDDTVTAAALPEEIALSVAATGREPGVSAESAAVRDLDAVERDAIPTAIARRQGNLTMVAKDLRISKSTPYLKIDKYGLNPTLRQARQHDR